MEKITPQQIVDDFFHEYCEGRLNEDEMVKAILSYARQYADDRDEFTNGSGIDGVPLDIPMQCFNCNWVIYLTSKRAMCEITRKEHKWEYTCNKHRLRD